ncbi:hypothetical protein EM595_3035 [Duffyella gerundensis]|uniref:Uncharacterized protein n=1 Tax=Duffyella gerundensis TaxID=1619313 RepID=A0A0U5GRA7_9GAMM|nr:hypothetical protein EM595_3035 [Duffyella gerundensis]
MNRLWSGSAARFAIYRGEFKIINVKRLAKVTLQRGQLV